MVEREKLVSTYMGMGVAIPHGTSQKKGTVKKSGVVLLQYPQGVDFGDEKATSCSALPVSATTILTCWAMSARSLKTRMRWNSSRPLPI